MYLKKKQKQKKQKTGDTCRFGNIHILKLILKPFNYFLYLILDVFVR